MVGCALLKSSNPLAKSCKSEQTPTRHHIADFLFNDTVRSWLGSETTLNENSLTFHAGWADQTSTALDFHLGGVLSIKLMFIVLFSFGNPFYK